MFEYCQGSEKEQQDNTCPLTLYMWQMIYFILQPLVYECKGIIFHLNITMIVYFSYPIGKSVSQSEIIPAGSWIEPGMTSGRLWDGAGLQCGGHAGGLFVSRWEQHEVANSIAHTQQHSLSSYWTRTWRKLYYGNDIMNYSWARKIHVWDFVHISKKNGNWKCFRPQVQNSGTYSARSLTKR